MSWDDDEGQPCDPKRCLLLRCLRGVDAIKDANAEAGREPYDEAGVHDARRNGWFRGPTY